MTRRRLELENLSKVVQFLGDSAKIEIWNRKNKYGWTTLMTAEGHRPGKFKPSAETTARATNLLAFNRTFDLPVPGWILFAFRQAG